MKITWEYIVQLEPKLLELEKQIKAVKDDRTKPSFCANNVWYRQFKPKMVVLVGWSSKSKLPELMTDDAYDVAYDHLYALLPNCRNCMCL